MHYEAVFRDESKQTYPNAFNGTFSVLVVEQPPQRDIEGAQIQMLLDLDVCRTAIHRLLQCECGANHCDLQCLL